MDCFPTGVYASNVQVREHAFLPCMKVEWFMPPADSNQPHVPALYSQPAQQLCAHFEGTGGITLPAPLAAAVVGGLDVVGRGGI